VRVLVTRPEPEAEATARALAVAGHEAVLSPVMAVRYVEPQLPDASFRGVVVTSSNGARGAARLPGAQRLFGLPLHVIGEATAAEAAALGFRQVATVCPDVEALAERLVQSPLQAGPPLLYAAGRDRRPVLERGLNSAGIAYHVAEVYRAEPAGRLSASAERALASGALDAALHLSRRSAQAFLAAAEASGHLAAALRLLHVAISAAAAEPLAAAGASLIAVAPEPTLASMIHRLDRAPAWRACAQSG